MNKTFGGKLVSDKQSRAALWPVLTQIDADLAAQACAQGCPHCGGAVHRADYPRKMRGLNVESWRDSFCCAAECPSKVHWRSTAEGCRRRETPGSVRFLGRPIYALLIVVLLTALRHGLSADRVRELQEQLGVNRRTLARWLCWRLEQFTPSRL